MKAALLIVLSMSALALAGPAFNKNNQIDSQDSYNTNSINNAYKKQDSTNRDLSSLVIDAKGPIVDTLKQWCSSSQMSQQELTASFKKLVGVVKSNPIDQTTEQAVMNERICSGASTQTDATGNKQTGANSNDNNKQTDDAQAHELIKDVYMDALIACKSRDCTQQLLKIIQEQSDKIDNIRASYYMTRLAVTEKNEIESADEIKQLADSFTQQQQQQQQSEMVERQKLFAVTAMVGKYAEDKPTDASAKQIAQQVVKTIEERYLRPVVQRDVEQYKQDQEQQKQTNEQLTKKIAQRNAALKALSNLPGYIIKETPSCQQQVVEIARNKQELTSSRQSAIECLEQNEQAEQVLKQITFDKDEPIEVRVAAYRALMTVAYSADPKKNDQQKQQVASKIIDELIKHCENSNNQQEDDQFVLYVISHLDNVRSSQQPEHSAIKECINKNKQHYMQIQVLNKKFKQQLADLRRSSRNYKLEQEFNQIESGLILEGDLIYESQQNTKSQQMAQILPKLIRVNMSMPVMGKTANVVEVTLRQNQMDEEILSTLKLVQSAKFSSSSVSQVVDSFKSSVEKQQQQKTNSNSNNKQEATEADLTIKIDGCTVVYLTVDDFKTNSNSNSATKQRQTRSAYGNSIVDDVVGYLKRSPINFNRGVNFNLNERIAKLLDVEANLIAGLRFESRAQGHSSDNFELAVKMEPRFNFEAIVGPAKLSSKKLLQRFSTKTAVGLRLRFKRDELVDVEIDLPMQKMELFTIESQIVERSSNANVNKLYQSYNYLPESIYGQEDIYSPKTSTIVYPDEDIKYLSKRSVFGSQEENMIKKILKGKTVQRTYETSSKVARATGLRGQVRVVVAPRDMSYIVSCLVDKYEPTMQGYRVRIQKSASSSSSKTYVAQVSTPGSRINRQMQMTFVKQSTSQRTIVKSEVQMGDKISAAAMTEIVHDGRQYSIKTELVSRTSNQWRHSMEAGLLVASNNKLTSGRSSSGFSYKPYVQVDSTSLKRPLQLQGTISYSQSPKSVITYELKCPTSGDFVQGKLIVDQRNAGAGSSSYYMQQQQNKQQHMSMINSYRRLRRSMQSPLELALSKDLTLTNELVAQVRQHAVKVHNMVDWSAQRITLQADSSVSHKNLRKSTTSTVSAQLKLDAEQQVLVVERKSSDDDRKEFRASVKSEWRAPAGHQMVAELRYNGRRQSVAAYKHNIDITKTGSKQFDCQAEMEIVSSEHRLNEKYSARARVSSERKQKQLQVDVQNLNRNQQAKIAFDYESLEQHQLEVTIKGSQMYHKCELRNNQRQFAVVSRTDSRGQVVAKLLVEVDKQQPAKDCKVVVELPSKRYSVAADLKLGSGQQSSLAIQTPRFVSQGEFSFETVGRPFGSSSKSMLSSMIFSPKKSANLRFRNQIKDLASKEAYWMDSALNAASQDASYFRFDSPVYRTDIEFDPTNYSAKVGAFARSKRSVDNYFTDEIDSSIYSSGNKNSILNNFTHGSSTIQELAKQLSPSKLWMLRAIVSSPLARRALVQYIDQNQSHKHSFEYNPTESSFNFDFDRSPMSSSSKYSPLRLKGDYSSERPISMSVDSDWVSANMEAKPFDEMESYARVSALSRHRRSPFKSHEAEWRHKKGDNHKAWMKHVDSEDRRHELRAESEHNPKKWAKVEYESDKHGKASWEHKWRKHAQKKRSSDSDSTDGEEIYANKVHFSREGPSSKHETSFDWEEPIKMVEERRYRRSIMSNSDDSSSSFMGRYSPVDYLKHTSARLSSSQYSMRPIQGQTYEPLYKVDFDYKPQLSSARLDVQMPDDIMHSSAFEMRPEQSSYKLSSKLYNTVNKDSIYDFSATTKPYVASLATADQEPVFVQSSHPMLERPIDTSSLAYKMFKQPMKLDYSDKYGRQVSFDYDQLPITSQKYAGLRQKRAAVFYKDSDNDFEHSSSYDFYPETFLGRMNPISYSDNQPSLNKNSFNTNSNKRFSMDDTVVVKSQTKYGPIVVRADTSDVDNMQCELTSPLVNIKLSAETGANLRKLVKFHLDNKQQQVQLVKLLRQKAPESIRKLEIVDKFARKLDSARFEHDTELLVSVVDSIFKIKSQTEMNSRKLIVIDGEWNQQQGKAVAKINGDRCDGQLVIDLIRKQAEFVLDAASKHGEPIKHQTRLVRASNNFYTLESTTSYKSRPLFKLVGKVSSLIFEEPAHFFSASRRHQHSSHEDSQHVSTFEAVVYEPNQYHMTGMYDCEKKEARIVSKAVDENKTQETIVRYDDNTETILFNSRLSSSNEGQVYTAQAKLNLPGLFQDSYKCNSSSSNTGRFSTYSTNNKCSSEVVYEDKSGVWVAKYQPNEYVAISTPRGKQTLKLGNYF